MADHQSTIEEWRPVTRFEDGAYEVSNLGRLRSWRRNRVTGTILRGCPDSDGYLMTTLYHPKRLVKIHQLVAEAFLGPRPDGCEVNHIHPPKTNNAVSNLEWLTPLENEEHATRTGLHPRGSMHPSAVLDETKVLAIRERLAAGSLQSDIGAEFGVTQHTIHLIATGRSWRHVGSPPTPTRVRRIRLTAAMAAAIKARLDRGESQSAVARDSDIARTVVGRIARGEHPILR